jgi:hypothetical protein
VPLETSAALVLLGAALALAGANGRYPQRLALAQSGALLAGALGALHLLGYTYGGPDFFAPVETAPIALETAAALVLAALGLVAARPENGAGALLAARGPGGETARRLVPLLLLLPPAVVALCLRAVEAGLVDDRFGQAGLTTFFTAVGLAVAFWIARRSTVQEIGKRRSEAALRARTEELDR